MGRRVEKGKGDSKCVGIDLVFNLKSDDSHWAGDIWSEDLKKMELEIDTEGSGAPGMKSWGEYKDSGMCNGSSDGVSQFQGRSQRRRHVKVRFMSF